MLEPLGRAHSDCAVREQLSWVLFDQGRCMLSAGDALMIAPIVHQGMTSTEAYFPAGMWYSLYDYTAVDASNGSRNVTVQVCGQ